MTEKDNIKELPRLQWFPGRLLKIKLEPLILAA